MKWIIGSVYMRFGRMKSIKKIGKEYDNLTAALNKIIIERVWKKDEVDFLIGGDFNLKLDYVSKAGNKSKTNENIERRKCISHLEFIHKFNLPIFSVEETPSVENHHCGFTRTVKGNSG